MEKVCEFCKSLRPIIYCKADAAHLCLSCDVKVHSANTLSSRHPRALLCQVCKYRPAYARCNDHNKFICRGCDCFLHKDMSHHQKKMVSSSYIGSPSAKDFAALWGFEMNNLEEFDLGIRKYRFEEQVGGSVLSSRVGIESEIVRSSREVYAKDSENQILQQIVDLEKFELSEANKSSNFIRAKQPSHLSASIYDTSWKLDKSNFQLPLSTGTSLDQEVTSFIPLDHSTSSNSFQEEPFWECASHDPDFEMWSENIQELGICKESTFFDSSNMPDVDVSFQNYEELFQCNQEIDTASFDEKETMTSSTEYSMSFLGKVDHSYARGIKDFSATSSKPKSLELDEKGRDNAWRYKNKKTASKCKKQKSEGPSLKDTGDAKTQTNY